jgi:preprotein translocase subunit YajC
LNNIALLGIFIMFLWLVAIGYYFYTSRQQNKIEHELDELRDMLGSDEEQPQG